MYITNKKNLILFIIILVLGMFSAYQALTNSQLQKEKTLSDSKLLSCIASQNSSSQQITHEYLKRLTDPVEISQNTFKLTNNGVDIQLTILGDIPDHVALKSDPYTVKFGFYYIDEATVLPIYTFRVTPHKPSMDEGDMSIYHENSIYLEPTVFEIGVSSELSEKQMIELIEAVKTELPDLQFDILSD